MNTDLQDQATQQASLRLSKFDKHLHTHVHAGHACTPIRANCFLDSNAKHKHRFYARPSLTLSHAYLHTHTRRPALRPRTYCPSWTPMRSPQTQTCKTELHSKRHYDCQSLTSTYTRTCTQAMPAPQHVLSFLDSNEQPASADLQDQDAQQAEETAALEARTSPQRAPARAGVCVWFM